MRAGIGCAWNGGEAVGDVQKSINRDELRIFGAAGLSDNRGAIRELLFQIGNIGERRRLLGSSSLRQQHSVGLDQAAGGKRVIAPCRQGWPSMKGGQRTDHDDKFTCVPIGVFQSFAKINHRGLGPERRAYGVAVADRAFAALKNFGLRVPMSESLLETCTTRTSLRNSLARVMTT